VLDFLGTFIIDFYMDHIAFYLDMFTLHLEELWCVCVYPWSGHHFRQ
jgi:hypothetical protein